MEMRYIQDIYVMQFSDGTVKVGRGRDARDRVKSHTLAAKRWGVTTRDVFIINNVVDAHKAEAEMIGRCNKLASKIKGREWFEGVNFDDLVYWVAKKWSGLSEEEAKKERKSYSDACKSACIDFFSPFNKNLEEGAREIDVEAEAEELIESYLLIGEIMGVSKNEALWSAYPKVKRLYGIDILHLLDTDSNECAVISDIEKHGSVLSAMSHHALKLSKSFGEEGAKGCYSHIEALHNLLEYARNTGKE